MQRPSDQILVVIIAVVAILLFLAILFLVMIMYHNNRHKKMSKEQQRIQEQYEKQILQTRLEIQQQTFHFISQEIHDNVGQVLSLAKLQLNILHPEMTAHAEKLIDIRNNVGKAMTELREIAKSLNQDQAQHVNWPQMVLDEIHRINKSGTMTAEISIQGEECFLKDHQKLISFRTVQEGLQNVLKHAKASRLHIHITNTQHETNILITDNGIGFEPGAALNGHTGLGLKNILNRVALIGGRAIISSAPGEGTSLRITISHS